MLIPITASLGRLRPLALPCLPTTWEAFVWYIKRLKWKKSEAPAGATASTLAELYWLD